MSTATHVTAGKVEPGSALPVDDDGKISEIRRAMPSVNGAIYLNAGTSGPLPEVVTSAIRDVAERQLHHPRLGRGYFDELQATKEECRVALAERLGVRSTEVALTHNTTEGMNFITLGVNWTPGDEAVTTNVEHPGALLPLWVVKERYGVTVKTADLASRPADPVDAVIRLITTRTKLVSLSHVSYSTGDVLPVAEIAAAAHDRGVLVLVDGAQSFAAMPLDLPSLGVDFYSVPGQKWLCGPEGTGALFSAQAAISQIRPTFASYGSMDGFNDYGGLLIKGDGRRFEQGTMHLPDLAGQLAACRWLTEVGPEWAWQRSRRLAAVARRRLAELDGVTIMTPPDQAGLLSFTAGDADPEEVAAGLAGRGVLARSIPHPPAIRLSIGYYNTDDEIAEAVTIISEVLNQTPP